MRLKNQLKPGRAILVIVPSELYRKNLMNLVAQAAKDHNRILYVALSESYETRIKDFKTHKISADKFYFIDARTPTLRPEARSSKNCTFVSSPEALTELKIAITKACEERGPEIAFFDSLSTLLSYLSDGLVARWAHDVIAKLRECSSAGVFMCLERDEQSYLVKDITMFVDKVIHLRR